MYTTGGGSTTKTALEVNDTSDVFMPSLPALQEDSVVVAHPGNGKLGKQRVVHIYETDPQTGDILIYQDSCSCYVNVRNTGTMPSILQFKVGITPNAPVDGDSTFIQTAWQGKWLEVYREGENQYYNDTEYGYEFDSTTATLGVHPPFTTGERVKIYVYNTTPVFDTLESPPPAWADLDFPTNTNLTSTSQIWEPTAQGSWGQFGLSNTTLTADGAYGFRYAASGGDNCIIGFNTTNSSQDYTNYEAGVLIAGGGGLYWIESGTPTSAGVTLSIGDYVRMHRVGSAIELQTSPDKITWTDRHTYSFSSSATLYLNLNIYWLSGTKGKLYYPQILVE